MEKDFANTNKVIRIAFFLSKDFQYKHYVNTKKVF